MTTPTPVTLFMISTAKVKDHAHLVQKIREFAGPNVWCVTHLNFDKGYYITYTYKTFEEVKSIMDERQKTGAAGEVTPPESVVMSFPISKYPSPAQSSTAKVEERSYHSL